MDYFNYFKISDEVKAAWFAFKRANPSSAISIVNFVAGWNAAKVDAPNVTKRKPFQAMTRHDIIRLVIGDGP